MARTPYQSTSFTQCYSRLCFTHSAQAILNSLHFFLNMQDMFPPWGFKKIWFFPFFQSAMITPWINLIGCDTATVQSWRDFFFLICLFPGFGQSSYILQIST